jgi:hypothetical protein
MHISFVRCWVSIGDLIDLLACQLRYVLACTVLGDCLEEGVDHGVRISLPALDPETTMEEAGVNKHLPDNWVSPIVRLQLRVNGDAEVVVAGFQHLGYGHHLIEGDANEILAKLLKAVLERSFVILTFSHCIADNSVSITNE